MRFSTVSGMIVFLMVILWTTSGFGDEPAHANAPFGADHAQTLQQAWSEHLEAPVQVANSLGMNLALIPPGQFSMGSPPDEEWHREDEVLHRVTLTRPFYMATTEVTQKQWEALMDDNPSFCMGDDLPVETVTWEQAAEFCRKLTLQEGVNYRLPTEAEWEYACRAGTTTPFHTGETISADQANYDGNSTYGAGVKGKFREETTVAGSLSSNAWGVHDMHGNDSIAVSPTESPANSPT